MHIAAVRGYHNIAELLIQNGSNVNIKNKVGKPLSSIVHSICCFLGFYDSFYTVSYVLIKTAKHCMEMFSTIRFMLF